MSEGHWGHWAGEPPCEHLVELKDFLIKNKIRIWSELGQEPLGWVNINCEECSKTYQTILQEPWCDECDGDDEGNCICDAEEEPGFF